MDSLFRRKLEMVIRVRGFGVEHAGLFPAGTKGAELFGALATVVDELEALAGNQVSGSASIQESSTTKSVARAALKQDVEAISLLSRALAVTTPGLDDKFRVHRNFSDQKLLATARAFAKDALPLKDRFIAFEMNPTFLEELESHITQFERSLVDKNTATDHRVAATAAMEAAMRNALHIVDQLRGLIINKLRNQDGLKEAWLAASRVTRSRKRTDSKKSQGSGESEGKPADELAGSTSESPAR